MRKKGGGGGGGGGEEGKSNSSVVCPVHIHTWSVTADDTHLYLTVTTFAHPNPRADPQRARLGS